MQSNAKHSGEEDLTAVASALLGQSVTRVERAGGGGNSRIYKVEAEGKSYALKMYPLMEHDQRDRLGVEKKTLQFFESHGVRQVPRWLNDRPGYALITWVEGKLANPPLEHEIEMAADFIAEIKRLSGMPDARELPQASESCMSGEEILRQIERRLERLQEAARAEPELQSFLDHSFLPALAQARKRAEAEYAAAGIAFDKPVASGACLIPADFGFHNAMRGPGGELIFIDFEYFGWDDPVKLVADFLLHPAMELSEAGRAQFKARMMAAFGDDPRFSMRLNALSPLFALRWVLILLNEFLPERWSGRSFARGGNEWAAAKERQLKKAKDMLGKADA